MRIGTSSQPTHKDIAELAGVSTYSVSVALAGKKGVGKATQKKVLAAAKKLGYKPNIAAALLAGRRGSEDKKEISVALLHEKETWDEVFLHECEQMGVSGLAFRPSSFASPSAASRILWNRGVHGVLIKDGGLPWDVQQQKAFKWDDFSALKLSRALPDLPLHLVRHSAFDYMALTLQKAVETGAKNIAVLLMNSGSHLDDDSRLGAAYAFHERRKPADVSCSWRVVESSGFDHIEPQTLLWLKKKKPDLVVLNHWRMAGGLMNAGYQIPGPIKFLSVLTSAKPGGNVPLISGCNVNEKNLMERGLKHLIELIGRGERGFAEHPLEHVVEPEWLDV